MGECLNNRDFSVFVNGVVHTPPTATLPLCLIRFKIIMKVVKILPPGCFRPNRRKGAVVKRCFHAMFCHSLASGPTS